MVVAPNASRLVSSAISRSWISSQTTTRRSRQGQSFWALSPLNRMSWSERIFRCCGTAHGCTTSKAALSFQARDKVDFLGGPLAEQRIVVISAIHHHDGAGIEGEGASHLDVAAAGLGDQHVARQIIVVVQQNVRLDATFTPAKFGPGKHLQA